MIERLDGGEFGRERPPDENLAEGLPAEDFRRAVVEDSAATDAAPALTAGAVEPVAVPISAPHAVPISGPLSEPLTVPISGPDPASEPASEPTSGAAAERGAGAAEASAEPLIRLGREELRRGIEAVLFASGEPVPVRALAELFECTVHDARDAIEDLRLEYTGSRRAFRIEDIAGGVQILTDKAYEPWIRRFLSRQRDGRLSPAAFETLAVIAYKQPINKADLEAIRGVQCGPILKALMDKSLVKVVGREETLGRPLLYGTTRRFLESFGIASLTALPQPELDLPAAITLSSAPAAAHASAWTESVPGGPDGSSVATTHEETGLDAAPGLAAPPPAP